MTTKKLVAYIKSDIKRLDKEQFSEMKKLSGKYSGLGTVTLDYLVTRKHTLKEILSLIEKRNW